VLEAKPIASSYGSSYPLSEGLADAAFSYEAAAAGSISIHVFEVYPRLRGIVHNASKNSKPKRVAGGK
jgi:hypothetical protein